MPNEEMKDLFQRVREMTKEHNFTIITPKALPITNRKPEPNSDVQFVDYLGSLENK